MPPLSTRYRWISQFEVILGIFLVIGHNIFKIVPNEVFFLFALFWRRARQHVFWAHSWSRVFVDRPKSVGTDPGPWAERYVCARRHVLGVGELT